MSVQCELAVNKIWLQPYPFSMATKGYCKPVGLTPLAMTRIGDTFAEPVLLTSSCSDM